PPARLNRTRCALLFDAGTIITDHGVKTFGLRRPGSIAVLSASTYDEATGQTSQKKHLATQPVAFRMPRSNTASNPLSGMACTISSLPRSSRISGHRVTFRSTAEETRTHHRYTGKDRRR